MHKNFYASGFLFHPKTNKILLQQVNSDSNNSLWSLFTKKSPTEEKCEEKFKDIFLKRFSVEIKEKDIYEIYSYFLSDKGNQKIFYAEVKKLQDFSFEEGNYKWFSQREIGKLNIPERVKHDIVVGFRVIDSSIRKKLGQQTIG